MIPKFAHILSHTKSMMVRSFDRKVNDGESMSMNESSNFVSEKHFYYDVLKELE